MIIGWFSEDIVLRIFGRLFWDLIRFYLVRIFSFFGRYREVIFGFI